MLESSEFRFENGLNRCLYEEFSNPKKNSSEELAQP